MMHKMIDRRKMDEAPGDGGEGGGAPAPAPPAAPVTPDWRNQIPEELRADPTIQNTKDVAGLASQLVNAQKMLGNAVRIPGKDAGEDDWNGFYSKLEQVPGVARLPSDPSADPEATAAVLRKLGVPESPDKYNVRLPEGVDPKDPYLQQQLQVMHELGVTNAGAQKFVDGLLEATAYQQQQMQATTQQTQQALKEKFGDALERVQFDASAVATQLGGEEFAKGLKEGGFMDSPEWLEFFNGVAGLAKESGVRLPDNPSQSGMTPNEAAAAISEIQNNQDHPYWNKYDPGHKAAVDRFVELHRIKRAGKG